VSLLCVAQLTDGLSITFVSDPAEADECSQFGCYCSKWHYDTNLRLDADISVYRVVQTNLIWSNRVGLSAESLRPKILSIGEGENKQWRVHLHFRVTHTHTHIQNTQQAHRSKQLSDRYLAYGNHSQVQRVHLNWVATDKCQRTYHWGKTTLCLNCAVGTAIAIWLRRRKTRHL
jgi:hypothetical protein